LHHADGSEQSAHGESLHDVMLQALHELLSSEARETK
jgi:hypothetical protein